jgi:Ca2+-binding EF-hand superfamily protein
MSEVHSSESESYELSEALLIQCKQSFSLFDLDTSGRIQSSLLAEYLSQVDESDPIQYMLSGITELGPEITYVMYLNHIKTKLKESSKLESFKLVTCFMDNHIGKEVKFEELKDLALNLGFKLSENEIKEVVDRIEISDARSEVSRA